MNLSLNILSLEPEICESKLLKVKVTCSVKKKRVVRILKCIAHSITGQRDTGRVLYMETRRCSSLSREEPLGKEMATHPSILVWEIPWTEEPGGLQSTGLQESDMT